MKTIALGKKITINIIWAIFSSVVLVGALIVFYWIKAQNEYYVSFATKITVLLCAGFCVLFCSVRIEMNRYVTEAGEIGVLLVSPVVMFYLLESMVNSMDSFRGDAALLNALIVFFVVITFFCLFSNCGIAILIGGGAIFAFYVIDYFVVQFRGTSVLLSDIRSAKTALGVASTYRYVLDEKVLVAFYSIACLVSLGFFFSRKHSIKEKILIFVISLIVNVGIYIFLIKTPFFEKHEYMSLAFEPNRWVKVNGLLLNDVIIYKNSIINEPDDYSTSRVEGIIDSLVFCETNYIEEDEYPNIIVVMNESFTDIDYLETVYSSEPTIPQFKEISKNSVSGTLISSILGGNTPNSEFEFLTGCSMAFLPQGIVAYQQAIDRQYETIATQLKNLGYSTEAVHIYNPTYFDRKRVYPLLGIDDFINESNYSREEVVVDYLRDYATDKSTFEIVEKQFEKGDNNKFIFAVTIQNHGGYWTGMNDITLLGQNSAYANEYLSVLKITDDSFADFIDYFGKVEEPTIVVMYGDHQPYLFDDNYVNIWEGYNYTNEEKRYMQAKTPFVIWANYDIDSKDMGEISINYLGPTVMEVARLPMSNWYKYLIELRKDVPVVSAIGYVDKEGNHFSSYEGTLYEEKLKEYEILQYNFLRGTVRRDFYGGE